MPKNIHNSCHHHKKTHHHNHHDHTAMVADFKKRFVVSAFLTFPILALSPMIQRLFGLEEFLQFQYGQYVLWLLSSVVFLYGGWPFLQGMYLEIKSFRPGMMTLVALAIATAYGYSSAVVFGVLGLGFFWELATLIDIMLLGHWIEMKSVMKASSALEELAKLMPLTAHLVTDQVGIKDIPIEYLKAGDIVLVRPGEKIPADGVVIDGASRVNESFLTGESKPIEKKAGSSIIAASLNQEGSLTVKVEKVGHESYLNQVIKLVKEAQKSKSKTQDLANHAAVILTIIAIAGGTLTFTLWFILSDHSLAFSFERAVTVMVITCPHALGLAVPLVVAVSTAIAARHGLLIRNRVAFEQARNVDAIIFDKTGTLTEGKFGITDVLLFDNNLNQEDLLSAASALESNSEHPIAKAIVSSFPSKKNVSKFTSIPGKGAQGEIDGKKILVVSQGYLQENNIAYSQYHKQIDQLSAQGKTVVIILIDSKLAGAIALADVVRKESKEAIRQLKDQGITCIMLTGDNKKVAEWVSLEIGIDTYFSEILPHEKAQKIKEVQSQGLIVAMIGDGVNDAPALAQADIGIAIGAGVDVAIEVADIILTRSNPKDVVSIINLSKATYKKMVQNLWWATGYNALAIPLAAGLLYKFGFLLSPALGAVLMSLSTVIVAINARRLNIT